MPFPRRVLRRVRSSGHDSSLWYPLPRSASPLSGGTLLDNHLTVSEQGDAASTWRVGGRDNEQRTQVHAPSARRSPGYAASIHSGQLYHDASSVRWFLLGHGRGQSPPP